MKLSPAFCLLLAACGSTLPLQNTPYNPELTERIIRACTQSGLFKLADGVVAAAVPAASLPIAVVNAGVDRVCADPERFSRDISTVEWVLKNLGRGR